MHTVQSCVLKSSEVWGEARTTLVCPSLHSGLVCVGVALPHGTRFPHLHPLVSHLFSSPPLLFIRLRARRVPEPALISIPHNTVYLPMYLQTWREVRMKGLGNGEREKAGRREGWEQEETEKRCRQSKSFETPSFRMKGVMMVRKT